MTPSSTLQFPDCHIRNHRIVVASFEEKESGYQSKRVILAKCNPFFMGKNKMLIGLTIGFALGAILGVMIGIVKKDIALWLSIGVGAGMSLGIIFGWLSEKK